MAIEFEKDWYKPICTRCPYFVNIEAGVEAMRSLTYSADKNKDAPKDLMPVVKCERPTDSECLGDNMFVQRLVVVENIQRMVALKRFEAMVSKDSEHKTSVGSRLRNDQRNKPYKRGKVKIRK